MCKTKQCARSRFIQQETKQLFTLCLKVIQFHPRLVLLTMMEPGARSRSCKPFSYPIDDQLLICVLFQQHLVTIIL